VDFDEFVDLMTNGLRVMLEEAFEKGEPLEKDQFEILGSAFRRRKLLQAINQTDFLARTLLFEKAKGDSQAARKRNRERENERAEKRMLDSVCTPTLLVRKNQIACLVGGSRGELRRDACGEGVWQSKPKVGILRKVTKLMETLDARRKVAVAARDKRNTLWARQSARGASQRNAQRELDQGIPAMRLNPVGRRCCSTRL
jgi:hypothetical protein